MSYLVFIKSGGHTAGPQAQTVTESQKAQGIPALTAVDYQPHLQTSSITESQLAQGVPAIAGLKYDTGSGPSLQAMVEAQKITTAYALGSFISGLANTQTISEAQQITTAYALVSFTAPLLSNQSTTESQKLTAVPGISSFNYV